LNHLVLEHLSGVKGGCPLEEAYYLKLSLFQGVEYFSEVFICYIDVWFLTRNYWKCNMDHLRDCIVEKGMPKPGPGG
jgi:hypothetical protein